MSIPHDHHFVPAFYLRQWCDSSGKLIEYTIKHRNLIAKPVGPDATGFEFDLYAFPELPPDQSQFIEQKFFDYADRTASDALQLHLTGRNGWTRELTSAWSRFVIALYLRHPDAMPELRAAAKNIWEYTGEDAKRRYDQMRQPEDPATYNEYLASCDQHTASKATMRLIIGLFDNERLGARVNNMEWGIVDLSASPLRLLTSDRPVELFDIGAPRGVISIPISPTMVFVAVNDPGTLDQLRRAKPKTIVASMNRYIVRRARRFVWASDESQTPYVRRHMSTMLEPKPFFPNLGKYGPASSIGIERQSESGVIE